MTLVTSLAVFTLLFSSSLCQMRTLPAAWQHVMSPPSEKEDAVREYGSEAIDRKQVNWYPTKNYGGSTPLDEDYDVSGGDEPLMESMKQQMKLAQQESNIPKLKHILINRTKPVLA
ncbi:unnamed protein product [Darwinula stevensoni]|uniref:Uncharacterized protein n=1 Tax=Darwinula stevensoni TaxID=69355 RepID=A0A7R9A2J2_9CRUS|nr:unnamed protein product [Darwinula stevensoni]CAG0889815.1 unnamed protein product [Darwinula stevensoni]